MSNIKIEITIRESEYKEWNDFIEGGIEEVIPNLREEIYDWLRRNYIRRADVEISQEE